MNIVERSGSGVWMQERISEHPIASYRRSALVIRVVAFLPPEPNPKTKLRISNTRPCHDLPRVTIAAGFRFRTPAGKCEAFTMGKRS